MPFFSFREGIFGHFFALGALPEKGHPLVTFNQKGPLEPRFIARLQTQALQGEVRNGGDFQAAVTVAGHFAPRCEAPPPPEVPKSKIGFRRTES